MLHDSNHAMSWQNLRSAQATAGVEIVWLEILQYCVSIDRPVRPAVPVRPVCPVRPGARGEL